MKESQAPERAPIIVLPMTLSVLSLDFFTHLNSGATNVPFSHL